MQNSAQRTFNGLIHYARDCLKSHHHSTSCNRCIDICPTQALSRIESVLSLDASRCRLCGACVKVCPTDALEMTGTVPQSKWVCPRVAAKRDQSMGCLQQLKPQQLVDMAMHSFADMKLICGDCKQCERYCAKTDVSELVRQANLVLKDIEQPQQIVLEKCQTQVDLGRRSLLRGWVSQLTEERAANTVRPTRFVQIRNNEPWKKVPVSHRTAVGLLKQSHSQTDAAKLVSFELPLFDEHSCAACPICVSACPTGALMVKREGENLNFSLLARDCIGCGLCADVCFKKAVSMVPIDTLDRRLNEQRQCVMSLKPNAALFANSFEEKTREIFKVPVYNS